MIAYFGYQFETMTRRYFSIWTLTVSICLTAMTASLQASEGSTAAQALSPPPQTDQLMMNVQGLRDESQVRDALRRCEKRLLDDPDNHEAVLEAAYLYYRQGWLFAEKIGRASCRERV